MKEFWRGQEIEWSPELPEVHAYLLDRNLFTHRKVQHWRGKRFVVQVNTLDLIVSECFPSRLGVTLEPI